MPPATSSSTSPSEVVSRPSLVLRTWGLVRRSGKPAQRRQQIEPRAAKCVLGDRDRGIGVARAPFGVDDLDIRRASSAEADVDDVNDLMRLVGGGASAGQRTFGAGDRLA